MSYSTCARSNPISKSKNDLPISPSCPAGIASAWYIQAVVVGWITSTRFRCSPSDMAADSRVMYWAITWYESHHGSW
jgi:hypothetical protein